MAQPTEVSVKELLEKVRGRCSGPCAGSGVGYNVSHAPCPDPCDQDRLDRAREAAKNEAYNVAQEGCRSGGKHCSCHGAYRALIPEQCVGVKDADGNDACLYFAAYSYVGECGYWF